MNTIFLAVPIGSLFEYGGTAYIKQSNRTAKLLENQSKWFYFSPRDRVRIMGKAV